MNVKQQKLTQTAAGKLKLLDIFLYQSNFSRPVRVLKMDNLELDTLLKRGVGHIIQSNEGGAPDTLIIRTALGVRLDKSKAKQVKPQTCVKIEADFLVLYEVKSKLSAAELKAFSQFNAAHNVWPFWRQHVADIVQRANLPKISIPLFSG